MSYFQRSCFNKVLSAGALRYGIQLSDEMLDSFFSYYTMISQYNTRTNLVSKRDMSRFVEYHLLDSLKVSSVFDFSCVHTMMDFGSGAGLPGVPLSLAFPEISTTLIESRSKRVDFLDSIISSFPFMKARVIKSRIQSLSESYNGTFDVVITRATVKLKEFFSLSSRFLVPGGTLIAIKGESISNEVSALQSAMNNQDFNLDIVAPLSVANVRSGSIFLIKSR